MATYYDMVKENAGERSELTKRQDDDVKLRNLLAYVMYKTDGVTRVDGVINVTLNRPKVMANYIITALGKTSEQIKVETEDKKLNTDYIKDFRRLAFASVDARLKSQGRWALNPYIDEQSCIRGGFAGRCLFRKEGDALIPDIAYWDFRYVNYATGAHGLAWGSYGYGTKKKKADIEAEPWAKAKNMTISAKEAEVVDVWTPDHNEIWLNSSKVFEQPHDFGFTPLVIQTVPLGSMLADKDDIKNQAESVFFLIREAVPELNRLVSIIQTLALNALKPPVGVATKAGATIAPENLPDYPKTGDVIGEDIGGGTHVINQGDANRAAQMALALMDRNMEQGGFIPSRLGSPPASGLALIVEKEGRDSIYSPRLELKGSVKQALGDMFTAQVIQMGGSVDIGTPGHKRNFDTGNLEGQYEVTHAFSEKSLSTQAGLASLAAALGDSVSQHFKNREILQLDDPDGEERWLHYEEAERLSALVKLRRVTKDLIALEEHEEAQLMADEASVKLDQLLSGKAVSGKEPTDEPTQVLGLFGGGDGSKPKEEVMTEEL